jgi:plastocyanin
MRRTVVTAALTFGIVLTLAACSSDSGSSSSSTTKAKESVPAAPVSLPGSTNNKGTKDLSAKGAATSVEVEQDDFYFNPTFLKVAPGQKITVELKNEGKSAHTFTSTQLGVDKELQPDSKATVTVTVPMSGTAVFYCRFHRSSGMQGAFVVNS